jgi:hypothetical protein
MSALLEFQRTLARAVMQPMSTRNGLKRGTGERDPRAAIALVKPNSRLTSQERLEIYCRSYWSRVLDVLADDFRGVRAVVGAKAFDDLRRDYLAECPSESWTLRNLGRRLPEWIERHPALFGSRHRIALDMARLEWAEIESFDSAEHAPLGSAEIAALAPESVLRLQPHLRLMEAAYEVDSLVLEIRAALERRGGKARALSTRRIDRARATAPIYLAIHRVDLVVHFKRLDAEMYRLLAAISQGASLGEAIERAYAASTLSEDECRRHAQESFALFASLGWFHGVKPGEGEEDSSCPSKSLAAS